MVEVIGPQGGVGDPVGRLLQHLFFPGGVVDGQAVHLFVQRHLHHRPHPPLKQGGQLSVRLVDFPPGLFQLVHGGSLPSFVKFLLNLSLVYHMRDVQTIAEATVFHDLHPGKIQ